MCRILLIDDDESVRSTLLRMLESLGHEATGVDNGSRGLELFDEGDFDLVITDIVMPGLSGIEMADVLKERLPSQRFLFISGYSSKEFGATLDAPPEPFLSKPFTIQELAEAVKRALEA